jgi:hypothetical protein
MRVSVYWSRARLARGAILGLTWLTVGGGATSIAERVTRELTVWMEPPPVLGQPSRVTVRALDRLTLTPVRGTVTIYGARDTTRFTTNQAFIYVFRCASTRRGAVTITTCERITVSASEYETAVVSYAGSVHPPRPDARQ